MSLVAFFMLDGARPDALAQASLPHLSAFRARASWSMTAQSVMPSYTLPCHFSIFHSVPPARHGVTSNTYTPMARPLPGLVEVATAAGKTSAFFYNWEPLRDLSRPEQLHYAYYRNNNLRIDGDDATADEVVRYLEVAKTIRPDDKPDFLFVYFGTVDTAGHGFGWMSDGYLRQLERVDACFGRVMAALPPDAHALAHSDHGGHERNHGTDHPLDMTIPWMVAGPRIKRNHAIAAPISLMDTAPTLAALLGLKPHPQWEGRCPDEIFA